MSFAQHYAQRTLAYNDFRGFRSSCTDLYNLLAILTDLSDINLSKIKDHPSNKIFASRIHVPVLQVKAYLRHVAMGDLHEDQDRDFLFKLDKSLYNTNSDYSAMRRLASDWHRLLPGERKLAATRLLMALRHMGTSDILHELEKVCKKQGYELHNVVNPETGQMHKGSVGHTASNIGKNLAIGTAAALGGIALGYALTRDKNH